MDVLKRLCDRQHFIAFALFVGVSTAIASGCKKDPPPPTEMQVEEAMEQHRDRAQRERDEG
ncbi:MAG: hypothetical protein ACR2NM_11985 [Bythopirellula sp.]